MSKLLKNPDEISIGVIGMSEENGHPYSWSAIFNGYDRTVMERECPYACIPEYLAKEPAEALRIDGAKVTHVFCDDRADAESVARSSLIPNVVDAPEDMIGEVDAVLIATDIGHEHLRRAGPFVDAGVPLFIDKPLCDNSADLAVFRKWVLEEKRPIVSSSAMRYAKELQPYRLSTNELGELRLISMMIKKKWETYGIHILEAAYSILGPGFKTVRNTGTSERNIVHLTHEKGVDVVLAVIKDVEPGAGMLIAGTSGSVCVYTKDPFYAFKAQLQAFVDYLRSGTPPHPFEETEELMRVIIAGIESRSEVGKLIVL
ncbi:MAG: Gfo/Idh/MocA family oxidoreductase [Victivallales bacterium]|nr:Gfo/Idh/MocA family oxidoreductase [Victivallales bacterium]